MNVRCYCCLNKISFPLQPGGDKIPPIDMCSIFAYRYDYADRQPVRPGDIVLLQEGELRMVGEVVFRLARETMSAELGRDDNGLHVRVLVEMREGREGAAMVEDSSRVIRHIAPARLTLLSRGRDSVRYLTGEPIRDGDVVAEPYSEDFPLSVVQHFKADDLYAEPTEDNVYLGMFPAKKAPGIQHGCLVEEYWAEPGIVSDMMQHYIFISRAAGDTSDSE